MCLLPLEGLPLSHFSETIRVGWAVGDTVRADVGVPRVRGSTVQPLPDGEVALLVACFLFSGQEDPLEKEMAPHSSTLVWKIPWTEEPGRLQSMWSQRVGGDWAT